MESTDSSGTITLTSSSSPSPFYPNFTDSNNATAPTTLTITNTILTDTTSHGGDDDPDYYNPYDDYDASKPMATLVFSWVFIVLFVVVFIVGLGGNCLVCFAVWRNPRMRSVTNIFLVNLAVADLLVVLICLPPTAAEDFFGYWHLGLEMCKIVKYVQLRSCPWYILSHDRRPQLCGRVCVLLLPPRHRHPPQPCRRCVISATPRLGVLPSGFEIHAVTFRPLQLSRAADAIVSDADTLV